MEWLFTIGDSCVQTLVWMAGLMAAFAILVCLMPCNRGMAWWKDLRGFATDLLYWLALPIVGRILRTALLAAALAVFFGNRPAGFAWVRDLPLWQQCAAILLLQDILMYWLHRGFHTQLAWRFHAVHHSPTTLDWLAASRFHLVNYLLYVVLADIVVLLFGFSAEALIALTPFNIIYASMVHANLNWTFGPLRFVVASPVFHRWHHTSEGSGTNFAATFPFLDLAFGTFHMPMNQVPANFGNGEEGFPEDFWGQVVYPFQRKG